MKILIKNVDVFDGKTEALKEHRNIVISDHLVTEIAKGKLSEENFEQVIDGQGLTAVPGLTDAHVHITSVKTEHGPVRVDEMVVHGIRTAKDMLLRGFTTVRDAGGITYGLKKGIDEGIIDGPRIYPSNAFISQTCGHGDSRASRAEFRITDGIYTSASLMDEGHYIADGAAEVMRAVREQLFLGASQIKISAGGGVSSSWDPILTVQYTYEEMKAAVDVAADYGTYVMAHLYTIEAMQRAARAGVKSFEHGQLMDEETARIIKDKDIFITPCPNFARGVPRKGNDPAKEAKRRIIRQGLQTQAELINKYDLKLLFGTDYVEGKTQGLLQSQDLISYKARFGSFHAIRSATGNINELIKLTTYQNPYSEGKIGVLEEGSYADILLVEGNPVADAAILAEPANLKLIMKDGRIYKDEVTEK